MKRLLFVLALLAGCTFTACATPSILVPKSGPGTPYPCGLRGRSCGNGYCCNWNEQCGRYGTNCPEGMCCYVGEYEDGRLFGAMVPDRRCCA